jgi:hypothetical protein
MLRMGIQVCLLTGAKLLYVSTKIKDVAPEVRGGWWVAE